MQASPSETDLIEVYAIAPVAPAVLVPARVSSPGVLKSPATTQAPASTTRTSAERQYQEQRLANDPVEHG